VMTLTATDVEGSALTYTIVTAPAHGMLSGTAPALTYTPAANYYGADGFTFKVNDGSVDSNMAAVSITINAVNDAPVAANDSYATNEGAVLAIAAPGILANDTDANSGDTRIAVLVAAGVPAHGALILNANGSFTYTPNADFNGTDAFQYQAKDAAGSLSNIATVTIAVNAVNDAPTFTKGADQTVPQDSGARVAAAWATSVSAGPSDESNQTLNFIVSNDNPSLFAAQPAVASNGTLTFTPGAGASGVAHVTLQLHDNGGTANGGLDTSAPQTFTVTIQSLSKPTLSIGDASVVEGNSGTTPMVFTVTLSAPSSVPVTVSYATLNGTATSRDFEATSGTLTFAAGETSKTVAVLVTGDTSRENSETLTVRLSNPVNATITRANGMGTIIDND